MCEMNLVLVFFPPTSSPHFLPGEGSKETTIRLFLVPVGFFSEAERCKFSFLYLQKAKYFILKYKKPKCFSLSS